MPRLLLILLVLPALACSSPRAGNSDDDDSGIDLDDLFGDDDDAADDDDTTFGDDDDDDLPDVIPVEWLSQLVGSVAEDRIYTSGALEGVVCGDLYDVNGVLLPSSDSDACSDCDVTFAPVVLSGDTDCPGASQAGEMQGFGFVLDEAGGTATVWIPAGLFSGWMEGPEATLVRDEANSRLLVTYHESVPGSFGTNTTVEDPCSLSSPCQWDAEFSFELGLRYEPPAR